MRTLLLILGVLLWAPDAAAQLLERAPYLQMTTTTETTVSWKTWLPSDGEVHWGDSPTNLPNVVADSGTSNHHEVTITGLQPDTRYYYAVYQGSTLLAGADDDHWVQTSPPVGTRDKFRVWVVGDSGTGGLNQAAVQQAMLDWTGDSPPDLYIHVGDMAYGDGTEWQFTWNFYAMYAGVLQNTTVWPTMGNHEGNSSDSGGQSGPYYDGYKLPTAGEAGGVPSGTEAYYSFDYANVHFVVLDSHDSPREVGGAMLTWLEADLQATTQEWIVAFWHHPPYTKGSHDSDTEGQLIQMRENALPILEAGGVDLTLTGHSHIYERSYLLNGAFETPSTTAGIIDSGDGRPQGDGPYVKDAADPTVGGLHIVAGHGGTGVSQDGVHPLMMFAEEANGSVILDFHENRLAITNVRADGVLTDRPAIVKGDAILVTWPDGGEEVAGGVETTVTWVTEGAIPNVDLEWSCDNGATWNVAATGLANTGSAAWTAPTVGTDQALVRVSSTADPTLGDESNTPFAIGASGSLVPIPWGSDWTYDVTGIDHGTAWTSLTFDDSAWDVGPGQLGYGDGDEATVVFQPANAFPSHYFRHVFTLDDPVTAADLTVLYDDGVVVWLNGSLVMQRDALLGTQYQFFATGGSDDNEVSTETLGSSSFVVGENVLAVLVKQRSNSSSDLSFDLSLEVEVVGDASLACDDYVGDDDDAVDDDDSASADDDDVVDDDDVIDDDDAVVPNDDDAVVPDDDDTVVPNDDDSVPANDDDAISDDDDSAGSVDEGCACSAAPRSSVLPLLFLGLLRRRR